MVLLLLCFLHQVQQRKFKISARLLCIVNWNTFLLQSGNNMSAFKWCWWEKARNGSTWNKACLNFSWSTSTRLSLNLTYVLISNKLSMEIFLGRKAARMTPQVLSLRLISYSMAEQFQGNKMDVEVTPFSACLSRPQLKNEHRGRMLKLEQVPQMFKSQKGADTATSLQRWRLVL